MILNTRRLFVRLLSTLHISVVCDIGSMDGADALRFRRARADARIYALEPNPENYRRMAENPHLRAQRIEVAAVAASDSDGEGEFFLVAADYSTSNARRGMASLLRRSGEWAPIAVTRVTTARVDTFLRERDGADGTIALWIDAEGMAHQVVMGAAHCASNIHLVHVEVETEPCVSAEQTLYPQVHELLTRLGFRLLATDQHPSRPQFNALFIRQGLQSLVRVRVYLGCERLRYLLVLALRRLCPACLGGLVRLRSLARGSTYA